MRTPTSEPPNLWLLAVPDVNQDDRTAADLFAFIDESLDLARLRAVARNDLGVDHLLPRGSPTPSRGITDRRGAL